MGLAEDKRTTKIHFAGLVFDESLPPLGGTGFHDNQEPMKRYEPFVVGFDYQIWLD